ncbi:MAG: cytochrome C oxidase subunit IV family protein [Acidobacteria bacterium]|nr:cytochrome C oxidase subunit IV family protein [Acidobacteriota bacterium]
MGSLSLVFVWAALLALTLAEVALAFPRLAPAVFLVGLLVLSTGKSALIVAYFMHMKLAGRRLASVLFPLLIVFILSLLAVLPDAGRLAQ